MENRPGTRFRLFVQPPFVPGYERPETIYLQAPAGSIGEGPSDRRIYVVDAVAKPWPYAHPYLPPYGGPAGAAAIPSPDGHFDHLEPGTRGFAAAHLYACVARTIELWEGYAGRRIPWHFNQPRLEVIPFVEWDNAQAGYGFLETGYGEAPDGTLWPFALSFDVVAHEIGHLLLYSLVGLPEPSAVTPAFGAFQESAADLVALVALLSFDTVIARLIENSRGNLYVDNELNQFGELSALSEIRKASNSFTLADVGQDVEIHALSQVLTGAFFDILVEAFLLRLYALGAIDAEDVAASRAASARTGAPAGLTDRVGAASERRPALFHRALVEARDFLAQRLVTGWRMLSPQEMTFGKVAGAFLAADAALGGENRAWLEANFTWRGIAPKTPAARPPAAARYPYRRIPALAEPYELQHSCALRQRRTASAGARP